MEAGGLIREARLTARLSQAELARRLETKQSVIARWETGVRSPKFQTVMDAIAACGHGVTVRLAVEDDQRRSRAVWAGGTPSLPWSKPTDGPAIKVLIVDSQFLLADALARVLSEADDLTVVSEMPSSGPDAVKAIVHHRPDVALIDYWLEGMDAWALTQALLSRLPRLKIIHLSWFHGPTQIEDSLASGAVGFLPKKLPVTKVEDAIRRAHSGEHPVFEAGLQELVEQLNQRQQHFDRYRPGMETLTPRELTVLKALGTGRPTEEIAKELGIKRATVQKHIESIMRKTQAKTQLEAVVLARDFGLIT